MFLRIDVQHGWTTKKMLASFVSKIIILAILYNYLYAKKDDFA